MLKDYTLEGWSDVEGRAAEAGISPLEYMKAWNIQTKNISNLYGRPSLTPNVSIDKSTLLLDQTSYGDSLDVPEKLPFNFEKIGGFFGSNWGLGAILGANAISSVIGNKSEYNGPKGAITQGMDAAYDGMMNAAGKLPAPYGPAIQGLMAGNKMLGNIANKLGGGTDGMTNTDAILGSSFFLLTPLGLINGFGGKHADTISKNDDAFEQVGSSYTGTESTVDDALTKSGKKYGLFSSGARKLANAEIAEAKLLLNTMTNIANMATDRFAILGGMSAINGNYRQFLMQGGYNQAAVHAGKHGMVLLRAKRISSANKVKERFALKLIEEPVIDLFKEGGTIEEKYSLDDFLNTSWEYKDYSTVEKFLKGGSFNVIPEGSLHAHKHNMDIDGVTKKGIPVVSLEEGGEIEQHAEIERDEITFRLEVSEKLEELLRKYESDEYTLREKDLFAIECGKLLTFEILENTQDRTGLIEKVV